MVRSTDAQFHRSHRSAGVVQSCRSKWSGWIARRLSRFTNNCTVKFEKNLRAAVSIQAPPVCLPREFSLQLSGISRPTVNQAFSKLLAEGYFKSGNGLVSLSADHLPATFLKAARLATTARTQHSPRVARRVTRMTDFRSGRQLDVGIAGPPTVPGLLLAGLPAVDEFPIAVWERLREQVLAKKGAHLLRYASSRGEIELRRKAIAAYLCDFRGANCHPQPSRSRRRHAAGDAGVRTGVNQ